MVSLAPVGDTAFFFIIIMPTKTSTKTVPPAPPQKKQPVVYEIRPIWEEANNNMIASRDKLNALAWKPRADTVLLRMSKRAGIDVNGDPIEKNAKVYTIQLPTMGGPDTPGPRTNKLGAINRDYSGPEGHARIIQKLKEHEGNVDNCDAGGGMFELWKVPAETLELEEQALAEARKNPEYNRIKDHQLTDKQQKAIAQVSEGAVGHSKGYGTKAGPRIADAPVVEEEEEELVEA